MLSFGTAEIRQDRLRLSVHFDMVYGVRVAIMGPSGAGKTTLLRAALGLIPATGQSNIAAMTNDARARHAAWMPQARDIAWPIRVEDAVRLGKRPGASDAPVIEAMARMELHQMARAADMAAAQQKNGV